jgi:hypothetical protein
MNLTQITKLRIYFDTDIDIYSCWPVVYYLPYGHTPIALHNKRLLSNETTGDMERICTIRPGLVAYQPDQRQKNEKHLTTGSYIQHTEIIIIGAHRIVHVYIR